MKGISLILTMIVVSLAMVIVLGAAGIFISELAASKNIELSTAAIYVADAGIEAGLYRDRLGTAGAGLPNGFTCDQINRDSDACLNGLANGGVYTYIVDDNKNAPLRTITSTGNYHGVKRALEVIYQQ